jgi:hypothetical protein
MASTKKIYLGTKAEHNKRREEEFLKLSLSERFLHFLRMMDQQIGKSEVRGEPTGEEKGNFCLYKDAV